MSIFDKFNNQNLSEEEAFEELCCQLFETWGKHTMGFDANWTYRNIRGSGGDGGIEAYWHNATVNTFIGVQAKWFRKSITPSQYSQIRRSIDTAMSLRPRLAKYIVCIPHNLTSLRSGKRGSISRGEEDAWKEFSRSVAQTYPDLELILWDEHHIGNLLQNPANEGRWRFWFKKTSLNSDTVHLALQKAIEGLKDRYIPEITDDGNMTTFLDNFFGTIESRKLRIGEIDTCLNVCHALTYTIDSFVKVNNELRDQLKESAIKCHGAISAYADSLIAWQHILTVEPWSLIEIDSIAVDYGAIESFEVDVQDLKQEHKLTRHVNELIKLLTKFKEMPSGYEIGAAMCDAFSCSHCLVIGEQGTGKTCGFASEALRFLNEGGHLPILIRASEINDQDGWKEIISNALGISDWNETDLWQALSSSAAIRDTHEGNIIVRAKVAIFVDGLDERQSASRWSTLIGQGDAITREYPRIKFAYSSRPHGIERSYLNDARECTYRVDDEGDVPAWKLFDRYIERYSIDLVGKTRYKWMLRTPMELRMFCTAYSERRIDKNVSTCLTELVNAEVNRLEEEYAARLGKTSGMHEMPVRSTLVSLATAFLLDDSQRDRAAICDIVEKADVQCKDVGNMLDFLERYGILATIQRPGATSVSPPVITYQPGSRHLWDYFMAIVLIETEDIAAANAIARHGDAAYMYAILLIERRGILPLKSNGLVNALGIDRTRQLTLDALADAEKNTAGKFRQWTLTEMSKSREALFEIVNRIIIPAANEQEHPLGPLLLDEYMRSFQTPIKRDMIWSTPKETHEGYGLSMYYERNAVKHLPRLHDNDAWSQTPLLLTWCLATVSNPKRRHCRSELVRWAMRNPEEYIELFDQFNNCNDPQIREDIFAIAGEVICQGRTDGATKSRFAKITLDSIFSSPDKPGNRDAALRHYGRMLIEKCCSDGTIDSNILEKCRPPYSVDVETGALPICAAATDASRMTGFETISYDLARYALVEKLESTFGIPRFQVSSDRNADDVQRLIKESAAAVDAKPPAFEGWVIAAAYQYLIDHGYEPDVFIGPVGERGYRLGGIDRRISGSFGNADHGSKSTVMTVAEKYVWCARNEICGFMADRIPVFASSWQNGTNQETYEFANDYSTLLSYQSPLFEATVNELLAERGGITPLFPAAFSCNDGDAICSEQDLNDWINSGSADVLISLLNHVPNVDISLEGNVIPIALYASDWSVCGKQSRGWAYCGATDPSALASFCESGRAAIEGYEHASDFVTSIDVAATYISPVEYMSAPWVNEYDENHGRDKIADVYVAATPLSGSGVDSLTEIGDYWYRFPSKLAMDLCRATSTDGAHYFDSNGEVVFQDVDFGEPYRQQYQALLADRDKLFEALRARDLCPIWYATLQRSSNGLADERLPQIEQSELSWLIWIDANEKYHSCRISDEHQSPVHAYEPPDLIKELLGNYAAHNGEGKTIASE